MAATLASWVFCSLRALHMPASGLYPPPHLLLQRAFYGDVYIGPFDEPNAFGKNASFGVVTREATFEVIALSAHGDTTDLRRYSLFAALHSFADEHFGCHLECATGACFAATCPSLHHLRTGTWNVSITLVRTQRKRATRACALSLTNTTTNEQLPAGWAALQQFIHCKALVTKADYQAYFEYQPQTVLSFLWNKASDVQVHAPTALCTGEVPGRWTPTTGGELNASIANAAVNLNRGMHHSFAPFNCSYKTYSRAEADVCIESTQPFFFGDSRSRGLVKHLVQWLGSHVGGEGKQGSLGFSPLFNHRFGLAYGMRPPEQRLRTLGSFRNLLKLNRTIVLDSIAHDVADFSQRNMSVANVQQRTPQNVCMGCNANSTVDACGCADKLYAVQNYHTNLGLLRDTLKAAASEYPQARIYWLTHHKRAPSSKDAGDHFFRSWSWQTDDATNAMENMARSTLEEANIAHIDFRHHLLSAPAQWWDDSLHYSYDNSSIVLHMSVQILLNRLCN